MTSDWESMSVIGSQPCVHIRITVGSFNYKIQMLGLHLQTFWFCRSDMRSSHQSFFFRITPQMILRGRCTANKLSKLQLSHVIKMSTSVELCSVLCGSLDGRGVWGRMDTCIHMAECLCCPPETITIVLIGSTLVWNIKLKKWVPVLVLWE